MATPKKAAFKPKYHPKPGKLTGSRTALGAQKNKVAAQRYASDNRTPAQMMQKPKAPAQSKGVNPFAGGILSGLNPFKSPLKKKGKS